MILDLFTQSFLSILSLTRYTKRIIVLSIDFSLCVCTVWLAFYLRLGDFVAFSSDFLLATSLSAILALPVFITFGFYRAIFRFSGWAAMLSIARALTLYGLLYAGIIFAIDVHGIPDTLGLIQPLLLFFAVASSRVFVRYWLSNIHQHQTHSLPKALIYGAGNAGRQLASTLYNCADIQVIGFLDDDIHLQKRILNGQPIFSPADLPSLINAKGVSDVLLALPSVSRHRKNVILKHIKQFPVAVRTLPSLTDLANGRVTVADLRDLDIDEVLGRDSVAPNQTLLSKNISDKVVLVSGAGGSIGSELCRQILLLKPARLLLVELSEFALYSIHAELERSLPKGLDLQFHLIVPLLGSVVDSQRMREIIGTWKPDTIYHAAAYKHVPLVEHNLAEGIRNNVFGTLSTAQAAIEHNVSDFVLISTDKAVRPTNVMGASKRLAELCLQALFAHHASTSRTRLSMVRFGNVLGSSGSVIPRFRQQIRDGGPVTLTHAEMTRFFMTIPEAAQLVIQAGAMANGGDVFVLDMGEPMKILDLARRIIVLSGLSVRDEDNPEGDIEISVTGLRPGEKLYEELLLGDDPLPTLHPKIMRAQDPFFTWADLEPNLSSLRSLLDQYDVVSVLALLNKLVCGFQHSGEIVDWVYVRNKAIDGYSHTT